MAFNDWKGNDTPTIRLITPEEFANLPDGTILIDIFGGQATKGVDYIDGDTRCGFMVYGLPTITVRII